VADAIQPKLAPRFRLASTTNQEHYVYVLLTHTDIARVRFGKVDPNKASLMLAGLDSFNARCQLGLQDAYDDPQQVSLSRHVQLL
jgi:hypothetical protein